MAGRFRIWRPQISSQWELVKLIHGPVERSFLNKVHLLDFWSPQQVFIELGYQKWS